MPFPLIPVIGAGASILGNIINSTSQTAENRRQRDFSLNMYNRQRQDALTDMQMQNEYNSPAAQMKRLKEAGLNPNLVYGGGGAVQPSAQVRSSSGGSYNSKAPQVDLSGITQSLMAMYDLMKTQAITDQVKANTELLKEKAVSEQVNQRLNETRNVKAGMEVQGAILSQEQSRQMFPNLLEKIKSEIRNKDADTTFTLSENERQQALQEPNLAKAIIEVANARLRSLQMQANTAESWERVNEIRQRIANLGKDERLKDFQIDMFKNGLRPGDPGYMRAFKEIMGWIFNF